MTACPVQSHSEHGEYPRNMGYETGDSLDGKPVYLYGLQEEAWVPAAKSQWHKKNIETLHTEWDLNSQTARAQGYCVTKT